MKYIEKVTITKFRSFGVKEEISCSDLNVFSGGNDSGKSNVLKALNLFFNSQSDFGSGFNSDRDFNKWYRDNNVRGERNIVIEVQFTKGNFHDQGGINKGFVAKKTFFSNGGSEVDFFDLQQKRIESKASQKRATSIINEKIQYLYIPAIRDIGFRQTIQRKIQSIAEANDKRSNTSPLKEALTNVEEGIKEELKELNVYVSGEMGVNVDPNVNFSTLLESLSFDTSEKIKISKRYAKELEIQKVALNSRGEGIQMQFFAFLLWYISKKDKKHNYIWGYEEPEIAFEMKRQFEILEIYRQKFASVAQIFVTSHSPAFAFCEPDKRTNVFRVSYELDNVKFGRYLSKIRRIEDYYEDLFVKLNDKDIANKDQLERDIWGINIQKLSKALGNSLDKVVAQRHIDNEELKKYVSKIKEVAEERVKMELELSATKKELENSKPANIFICEDDDAPALWEALFNKVEGLPEIKVYSSGGCTNDKIEIVFQFKVKEVPAYKPKIFRELDRDGLTENQMRLLELKKSNKYKSFGKYKVKFLPVNEIENFGVMMESYFTSDLVESPSNSDVLTDAFWATAGTLQKTVQKYFDKEEEKKHFNLKEQEMIQEARKDKIRYFPGKEIKKLKSNFDPSRPLKNSKFSDLPQELQDYLLEIKSFFA